MKAQVTIKSISRGDEARNPRKEVMNEALIKSVRAVAKRMPIIKTCKPMPVSVRQDGLHLARPQDYDECDMRLVLAALERAERIEKAARARKFAADIFYALPEDTSPDQWGGAIGAMRGAEADLDAALSEPHINELEKQHGKT